MSAEPNEVRIALAGNPNAGKTSIFNGLTGAHQHVGNYPGVTVEKRSGSYLFEGQRFEVLDLPGTYSLSSYSPEERVAQEELERPDLDAVVVVVDSTNLKRNLVLLAQILQTGTKTVLCLNMSDEAKAAGQELDLRAMESLLGLPVVETVGHKAIGIDPLKRAIARAIEQPFRSRLVLGERLDHAIACIVEGCVDTPLQGRTAPWFASRLLLDDASYRDRAGGALNALVAEQRAKLEANTGMDIGLFVTEQYFGFVDGLLREVVTMQPRLDTRAISHKVDAVLAHRVLGLPIFALLMYAIFWVTFTVGAYPMEWIEGGFSVLGGFVSGLWAPGSDSALRSLLVDGVIGGVGGVMVFLPNIVLLFLGLALLEDTGYMARAAFLVDRALHRFGLHGNSFIPMMTGFGCSIPGIMATRTLENERDRLATILVLPLMSCGARLPIWMLLIPAFFAPAWQAPMLWAIYVIGIMLALLLALLLRKSVLRGEEAPFVMELPPYRMPTLRAVLTRMTGRAWLYMRKAGTIILAISVLMWVAMAYPKKAEYAIDEQIRSGQVQVVEEGADGMTREQVEHVRSAEDLRASFAGQIGLAIEPVLRPLGFDWKLATAMLGAFVAKEVFVAQLGIIYAMGTSKRASTAHVSERLHQALRRDYSPLVGFCLMLFLLIATPCMATIAVTKRETGSWKWAALQLFGLTAVAYLITLVVYQVGRLFV